MTDIFHSDLGDLNAKKETTFPVVFLVGRYGHLSTTMSAHDDSTIQSRPTSPAARPPLDASRVRAVAVAGGCDPRSVVKFLSGRTIQSLTRERVVRGLREMGFDHLIPA